MKIRICIFLILMAFIVTLFAQDITPIAVLEKFDSVIEGISDYQCRLDEWCVNGNDREKRVINLYFKKPRHIRIDIIEGNGLFDPGSVAVYSGGNEVEGKKGGLLSLLVLKLDKKDPMATSIRGVAVDESDLIGILTRLKFHLKYSVNTVIMKQDGTCRLTGIVKEQSKSGKISKEVLYFDPTSFLPVQMEGYEGNEQVMHTEWSGYIINAGLPAELFDVNFPPLKLKEMGIKTLK